MKWYIDALRKYAVFGGRARRKEYWMFFLFNTLIAFSIGFVFTVIGTLFGVGSALGQLANSIYTLAVLVPCFAVGVRRLHDIGRSGWWILVPVVNLVFLCLDSQPSDNEYGPNPKTV